MRPAEPRGKPAATGLFRQLGRCAALTARSTTPGDLGELAVLMLRLGAQHAERLLRRAPDRGDDHALRLTDEVARLQRRPDKRLKRLLVTVVADLPLLERLESSSRLFTTELARLRAHLPDAVQGLIRHAET